MGNFQTIPILSNLDDKVVSQAYVLLDGEKRPLMVNTCVVCGPWYRWRYMHTLAQCDDISYPWCTTVLNITDPSILLSTPDSLVQMFCKILWSVACREQLCGVFVDTFILVLFVFLCSETMVGMATNCPVAMVTIHIVPHMFWMKMILPTGDLKLGLDLHFWWNLSL